MILFISPKYGNKADAVSLIQAARKRNIRTETLLNTWDAEKARGTFGNVEQCAVYGEHSFCEFVAQEMHWNLYSNSLDWITKIPRGFVKRHVDFMTLQDIIDEEAENRTILGKKLLEPADEPIFKAGFYDKFPRVPVDTPILVHSEVTWQAKYRFIIINGKIASYCCYRVANVANDPVIHDTVFVGKGITADAFVRALLDHVRTAPSCIIDVGCANDIGWSVCGTYPVWSSELYGCSADAMLKALFVACEPLP